MLRSTELASLGWAGLSVVVSGGVSLVTLVAFLNGLMFVDGVLAVVFSGTTVARGNLTGMARQSPPLRGLYGGVRADAHTSYDRPP